MALEIVNFWNKTYFQTYAPKIKVFKLDKTETIVDELYGEEKTSRIYTPPFEINSFHFDNSWAQVLGPFALTEQEENITFVVNFKEMVQKIRDEKKKYASKLIITYSGTKIPAASKTTRYFTLKLDGVTITNFDLLVSERSTVKKLAESINALDNFSVTLYGRNDSSTNLVNFSETSFYDADLEVFSYEKSYNNVTDVIEMGDLILTKKWRLYEVMNALPRNSFLYDWITYNLSCKLARLDQISLPGDYEEKIIERQYDLKDTINME
jgi:hypothetical protein